MNLAGCSVVQNRLALCDIVVVEEGVSKLSFQCGSRDAKFCVSTIWLGKLLIFNVLCVLLRTPRRGNATFLQYKCR